MELVNAEIGIQLCAVVLATASAVAIFVENRREDVNRLTALLLAGVVWWAGCCLLRAATDDAARALLLTRAASPGFVFVGPLALHIMSRIHPWRPRWPDRWLPVAYGLGVVFLGLAFTPLHSAALRPSPWGWRFVPGPAFLPFYGFTMANALPACALGLSAIRSSPSASERSQGRWIAFGVALPVVLASVASVLLPLLGVAAPNLGPLSFATMGAVVAWTGQRHGHSPLARGSFTRQIVDAHPDGVALVYLNGRISHASAGLGRLVGRTVQELAGRDLDELLATPIAELARECEDRETELVGAAGDRIPVAVSARRLRDRRGLDFALAVVIRDLREVTALRSRLVTSGRLAAMGQLAAGIAHEINNPMAYVRANLSLLHSHWERLTKRPPDPALLAELAAEGEELLQESLEGVERTCAIVRDIRSFSHSGSGEREAVPLPPLLDNVLRVASPQLRDDVVVERHYDEVPPVLGAPQELRQVFLNLVVNAAHAVGSAGRIRISARAEAGRVVVAVEDDGCGIAAEALEQVFDPFFTTKPVGEGTGMGLFISYQIVRRGGGEITVSSRPGHGTRVCVDLPALSDGLRRGR